jgi:uncharacterized damage-inducible protein DinB
MSSFIEQALSLMNSELNRIEVSVNRLSDAQIWTRLRENTSSIGNLCMHLAGNEYQNIVSGIGGKPFIRERSMEFEMNEGMKGEDLILHLRNIRKESEQILGELTENDLKREIKIYYSQRDWQRMKERKHLTINEYTAVFPSVQALVFHVAEHYGYHSGQIVFIAKMMQSGVENITEFRH